MRISDWSSDVSSSDLGARSVAGTEVTVKRVPELMPEDVARKAGAKLDQEAPIAKPQELADYDAVIFGTQIGRASCRERVCQYVEISVVAVSLKKIKSRKDELSLDQHCNKKTSS